MIILDTNVLSEHSKKQRNEEVTDWLNSHDRFIYAITAITVAEIWSGILRMPSGKRKEELREIYDQLFRYDFANRILPFDAHSAPYYGDICSYRRELGKPIEPLDAQIAAICRANDCELATRNTKDFAHTGIATVNPWGESAGDA